MGREGGGKRAPRKGTVRMYMVLNTYPYPAAARRHHVYVVAADTQQARALAAPRFAALEDQRARRLRVPVDPEYADPLTFDVVLLADGVERGGASEVWA